MIGTFETPEAFEERMGKLKKNKKLSHFECEQLLLSHMIASRLIRVEDILGKINNRLGEIEKKQLRYS